MSKTPLYIIPARGGSKGIPRKNIKNFAASTVEGRNLDIDDLPDEILIDEDF